MRVTKPILLISHYYSSYSRCEKRRERERERDENDINPRISMFGVGGNGDNDNDNNTSTTDKRDFNRSRIRRRHKKKNRKNNFFAETEDDKFNSSKSVEYVCSQLPTSANDTNVTCGAMNPFSTDVPYNSAGISLAYSTDRIPGPCLSPGMKRRKRPILLSSIHSFSYDIPTSNNNTSKNHRHNNNNSNRNRNHNSSNVQRRLTASNVSIPTSSRRRSFRSASPSVERFNYAKALIQSDHELEKLSSRIRAEINESELFELAIAAERAADGGENHFSGRASTFGGDYHYQQEQQQEQEKTKDSSFTTLLKANDFPTETEITTTIAIKSEDSTVEICQYNNDSTTRAPFPRDQTPDALLGNEISYGSIGLGSGNASVFPDRSLLDQTRATATTAVVAVAAPTVHPRKSTEQQRAQQQQQQQQQQPSKRSMRIESLRNVNEVIPRWKELHSHMRTHFYRKNVDSDVLVFRETKSTITQPSKFLVTERKSNQSSSKNPNDTPTVTTQTGSTSFFENIAGLKLLPNFRANKMSERQTCSHDRLFDVEDVDQVKLSQCMSKEIDSLASSRNVVGATLSSHLSPKNELSAKIRSTVDVLAPPGLTHPDVCINRNDRDTQRYEQTAFLTEIIPGRPESIDQYLEAFPQKRSGHLRASSSILDYRYSYQDNTNKYFESSNSENGHGDTSKFNDGQSSDQFASRHESTEFKSILSTPKGMEASSGSLADDCETDYSTSPLQGSNLENYINLPPPQQQGPSFPIAPLTPKSHIISRRKESGFSTPAHLRIIKRLHISGTDEKRENKSNYRLGQTRSDSSQKMQHYLLEQEDILTVTPSSTTIYSPFEPNSIIDHSRDIVTTGYLAIPTIHNSKSESDIKEMSSRIYVQQKKDIKLLNGSQIPLDSWTIPTADEPSEVNNVEKAMEQCYDFTHKLQVPEENSDSESVKDTSDENYPTEYAYTSHLETCKSCDHPALNLIALDSSLIESKLSKEVCSEDHASLRHASSAANTNFLGTVEEKKESDHVMCSIDLNSIYQKDKMSTSPLHSQGSIIDQCYDLDEEEQIDAINNVLHHTSESERKGGNTNKTSSLITPLIERKQTWESIHKSSTWERESSTAPTATETVSSDVTSNINAESKDSINHISSHCVCKDRESDRHRVIDANSFDTISVCHSLPQTDANFKAAVRSVFSHLSLGSPRNKLQLKDFQTEGDNKEFLSNYFYCAKTEQIKAQQAVANEAYFEGLASSSQFKDGLGCVEPCNERDSLCFSSGIDTVCGGLMHYLPKDVESCTLAKSSRDNRSGVLPIVKERSASFSTDKSFTDRGSSLHAGVDYYQHPNEMSWLGIFRRVASDRFNIQFQSNDNEIEKAKHPFEPPCLTRKVLLTRTRTR